MKKLILSLLMLTAVAASGEVVRLAPNFPVDCSGKTTMLRGFQGKPVVIVIGKSARESAVRAQVKKLKGLYQEFASRQVIFIAALKEDNGEIRTDIPFVFAKDGAKVAAAYGVDGPFNLVIIGKDGNIDLQSAKVCPASRVRDVIINSFVVQSAARR